MSQILNLFKTGKIIKNGERNKSENKKSRNQKTKQKKKQLNIRLLGRVMKKNIDTFDPLSA